MKKIFLIILGILAFSFLIPQLVQAGLVPCGLSKDDPEQPGDQTVPCQFCHLFVLFKNIIEFIIKIIFVLAILMIAIAGFLYIFAYINPEEALPGGGQGGPALLSQVKKILTSVIYGLIIIFAAWLIVGLFLWTIGLAEWTEKIYKNWWTEGVFQIPCPI